MRAVRPLLPLCLLLLASCATSLPPVLRYAWPPEVVEYGAVQERGTDRQRVTLREIWNGPSTRGSWQIWQVETLIVDQTGIRPGQTEHLGFAPGAWGLLAVGGGDAPMRNFEPPLVYLRGDVEVGDAWFGEHATETGTVTHGCEMLAYAICEGGVTSRCVTDFVDRRAVVERDYCPEQGLKAWRREQFVDDQLVMRMRNDEPLKARGEAPKRPTPKDPLGD